MQGLILRNRGLLWSWMTKYTWHLIYVCRFQSSHVARRLAIRHCPICLSDRMFAMAEGGVGRSALHQISKLAQRDAQHSQETEIISVDQLTGAEVSFLLWIRRQPVLNCRWNILVKLLWYLIFVKINGKDYGRLLIIQRIIYMFCALKNLYVNLSFFWDLSINFFSIQRNRC